VNRIAEVIWSQWISQSLVKAPTLDMFVAKCSAGVREKGSALKKFLGRKRRSP